jgi:putative phosphoribosyl transferase
VHLPVGYFGASTGAAAALVAAAEPGVRVGAIVSRGGRPDLAGNRLGLVHAPTLLIVGGRDHTVLELNRHALAELQCPRRLSVVPGATHLFEENGGLEAVAELAKDWFTKHLTPLGQIPSPREGEDAVTKALHRT